MMSLLFGLLMTTDPVEITATPFPNDITGPVGCTAFESGIILNGDEAFGGISAMRLEGNDMVLMSDDALAYRAEALRNQRGFIAGLDHVERIPLADNAGDRLEKLYGDSESLVLEDGSAIVGLERQHRLSRFTFDNGSWRETETLYTDDRPILRSNSGFEGLTRLSDGRLLAISEGTDADGLATAVFLPAGANGPMTPDDAVTRLAAYRPAPEFSVTDLGTDPQTGDVFVLERAFSKLRGPRARLVRLRAADIEPETTMRGEELARLSALNGVDNMEGLALERRDDGTLLAHIISDDNYNQLQQTVLMGFLIDEAKCSAAAKP